MTATVTPPRKSQAPRGPRGHWLTGHLRLGPDHGVWDTLLALITRREAELRQAREGLEKWLQHNRTPPC